MEGLGAVGISKLIERFGSAKEAFDAKKIQSSDIFKKADQIVFTSRKKGIDIISLSDLQYPGFLKTIPDPPPVLYTLGNLEGDVARIAIVGSRSSTYHSLNIAETISSGLGGAGITIVSGFARGVDTAAHRGAVLCSSKGGGRTIAVMGCGVDIIYPEENKKLYEDIIKKGAIISEFPPQTPPFKTNFPKRNRIISGLCLAVVVVQATRYSGALITARLALEQGREVFTVPGPGGSERYRGSNDLIRQGAKIVESATDILEELQPVLKSHISYWQKDDKENNNTEYPTDDPVLNLLSEEPIHIDTISEKLLIDIPRLSTKLFEFEVKGLIKKLPGGKYIKK